MGQTCGNMAECVCKVMGGPMGDDDYLETGEVMKYKRWPTDVPCLVVFFAFWIGMFVVAGFGFAKGNPKRLYFGTDSTGDVCGVSNQKYEGGGANRELSDKKYLYWVNPLNLDSGICIGKCPEEESKTGLICDYEYQDKSSFEKLAVVGKTPGCMFAIATEKMFYRCIPKLSDYSKKIEESLNSLQSKLTFLLGDMIKSWFVILSMAILALLLGFVFLVLLRFFVGPMVWATIIALVVVVFISMVVVYICAFIMLAKAETATIPAKEEMYKYWYIALFVIAGVLTIVWLVLMIVVIWMRKRIQLAIEVMKVASEAVGGMPQIMLYPLLTFGLLGANLFWFVFVGMFLASAGEKRGRLWHYDRSLLNGMIYHLFGFLWTNAFILAIGQTVIAGAIASWYWARDKKKDVPSFPVIRSFGRAVFIHAGSMAFGSFLIALVQLIRILMKYLEKKLGGKGTDVAGIKKILFKIVHILLWLFEKFIKFINTNAYILIAIKGYSFCAGAYKAFQLIVKNIFRFVFVDVIGDFFLFLGKVLITLICGLFAAAIFQAPYFTDEDSEGTLSSPILPVLVVMFVCFIVSSSFMNVYEMAINTIFVSFCYDEELKDLPGGHFATENLLELMSKAGNPPPPKEDSD